MKSSILTLATIAALTLAPRPAHALDDAVVNSTSAISYRHDGRDRHDRHHGDRHDRGRDDRHDRDRHHGDRHWGRPDHDHRPGPPHFHPGDRHHGDGHWTYRTVRVWVPKRTWFTYDRWGNRVKHFQPGHWSYQREKVWVPGRGRW